VDARPPAPPAAPAASDPRERLRLARRLALLEAAEAAFAECGYAEAKMADIAARAGYSAGNLYNSFESKRELFRAVLEWRGEETLERLRRALRDDAPAAAVLDRFLDAVVSHFGERRAFFRIWHRATHALDGSLRDLDAEEHRAARAELEARLEGLLRAGVERGELAPGDAGAYADLVLGGLNRSLARIHEASGGGPELAARLAALRAALRRALGAGA
jgi:AcrR family transcriptional regulator